MYDIECLTDDFQEISIMKTVEEACSPYWGECFPIAVDGKESVSSVSE